MRSKLERLVDHYEEQGYTVYRLRPKPILLTLLLPLVSIIPHELGHYLVAYGLQLAPTFVVNPESIGVRMRVLEMPLNEWFLVTLGGPIAGALFLWGCWRLGRFPIVSRIVQAGLYLGFCSCDIWMLLQVLRVMI